jgi:hypothetical protein
MAGLLDGLEGLGLGKLENLDIFEEEKKEAVTREAAKIVAPKTISEEEIIYDKEFECPICNRKFMSKVMKTGKTKMIAQDDDMRPKYEGIDANKYDVVLCPRCGYAAIARYFGPLLPAQTKLIKENICASIKLNKYDDPTYGYDQAFERIKIALACAVVKKSKISEKAFICLKTAWLLRGKKEMLEAEGHLPQDVKETLENQEKEYLKNAYTGFLEARGKENPPIAGMDTNTLDYLLAQLAYKTGDYDTASRLVAGLLSTRGNERLKNKVLDLKELVKAAKEKNS